MYFFCNKESSHIGDLVGVEWVIFLVILEVE